MASVVIADVVVAAAIGAGEVVDVVVGVMVVVVVLGEAVDVGASVVEWVLVVGASVPAAVDAPYLLYPTQLTV